MFPKDLKHNDHGGRLVIAFLICLIEFTDICYAQSVFPIHYIRIRVTNKVNTILLDLL